MFANGDPIGFGEKTFNRAAPPPKKGPAGFRAGSLLAGGNFPRGEIEHFCVFPDWASDNRSACVHQYQHGVHAVSISRSSAHALLLVRAGTRMGTRPMG